MGETSAGNAANGRGLEEPALAGFVVKQKCFGFNAIASGKSGQFPAGADDSVAGHDNGYGILPAGGANGLWFRADLVGDVAIGQNLSERDFAHDLPYAKLKVGALEMDGNREGLETP